MKEAIPLAHHDGPISFDQERLWFIEQATGGSAAYHVPYAVDLDGPVDVERLGEALRGLMERHASLRSSIVAVNAVPVQRTHHRVDLSLERYEATPESLDQTLTQLAARPFDLAEAPLVRAALVHYARDRAVLLVTAHHVLIDGRSVGVIGRELGALYSGVRGGPDGLADPPAATYADFAGWQRGYVETDDYRAGIRAWRARLSPPPEPLVISTDVDVGTGAGRQPLRIGDELRQGLHALCKAERATEFMGLMAALVALLARYTDSDDLVIATPVDGRPSADFDAVVGFFVNTLPLRVDASDGPSFRAMIRRTRDAMLSALRDYRVPYGHIVRHVNPARHGGRDPLTSVLLSLEYAEVPPAMEGLVTRNRTVHTGAAPYPLTITLTASAEGLDGMVVHDRSRLGDQAAQRFVRAFVRLIETAVAASGKPIGTLPLADPDSLRVVAGFHDGPPREVGPETVVDLVLRRASAVAGLTAIEYEGQRLTYRQLSASSADVARRLREAGAGPGAVVGVWMRRGLTLPVALLGILRAGAAYLPLDPDHAGEFLRTIVDEAAPVAVVVADDERNSTALPIVGARLVDGDSSADHESTLDGLAYVIYTSGSTGRPKGVAMPHRPLVNLLHWQSERSNCGVGDRTLQFASVLFDVSFQEVFSTFVTGGTLVVPPDEVRLDSRALARFVADLRIDRVFLPFVALHGLAAELAEMPPGVGPREVIAAGEQLRVTPALVAAAQRQQFTVDNQYGPTETHVVTAHLLSGDPRTWEALPPIGRPITGAVVQLLDDGGNAVPVGMPGELHVGGAVVGRGYYADPEQTAQQFRLDPAGAVTYRTGDLARYRPDGTIEFLGRRDRQVKIRGHRVELGAVENALGEHPAIAEAVADAVALGEGAVASGEAQLCAYLVRQPGAGVSVSEIAAFARDRMAGHLVPTLWRWVDTLPRTPTGKLDRRRLAEVSVEAVRAVSPGDEPPPTAVEQIVLDAFADCLPQTPGSVTDSFFALGGHSLLAARLAALLRHRLLREVHTADVFLGPSPRELAALAEQRPPVLVRQAARAAAHMPEELPVTPAQENVLRVRVDERTGELTLPFTLPVYAYRVEGQIDLAVLADCLDSLVERHEALRVVVTHASGVFTQRVRARARVHIDHVIRTGADMGSDGWAYDHIRRVAERPFRLAETPRMRVVLADTGENESVLAFIVDHLTADDGSMRLLISELGVLYQARMAGEEGELRATLVGWRDFVLWNGASRPAHERSIEYWRSVLRPEDVVPEVVLPFARSDGSGVGDGFTVERPSDTRLADLVREIGVRETTSAFVVLAAAVQAALVRYTSLPAALVTPIANRDEPDWELLCGYLSYPVIVRPCVTVDQSLGDALRAMRQMVNADRRHYGVPYWDVQRRLAPGRFGRDRSAPWVLFNVLQPAVELSLGDVVGRPIDLPETVTAARTIAVSAVVGTGIALSLSAADNLLDEPVARTMVDDIATVVSLLAEEPNTPVSALPLRAPSPTPAGPESVTTA